MEWKGGVWVWSGGRGLRRGMEERSDGLSASVFKILYQWRRLPVFFLGAALEGTAFAFTLSRSFVMMWSVSILNK